MKSQFRTIIFFAIGLLAISLLLGLNQSVFSLPVMQDSEQTCYTLSLEYEGSGENPTATPMNSFGCADMQYTKDAEISLEAMPIEGWFVKAWQGTNNDDNQDNNNSVTMPDGDHTVKVFYETPVYLPLIITPPEPPKWELVGGDNPDGVSRFYAVAVCKDKKLAGSDVGLYSLVDPQLTWQIEENDNITGFVAGIVFVPDSDCKEVYVSSNGSGIWYGNFEADSWNWQRVDDDLHGAFSVAIQEDKLLAAGDFGIRISPLPHDQIAWNTTNINSLTISINGNPTNPSVNILRATVWNDGVYGFIPPGSWGKLGDVPDPLVYQAIPVGPLTLVGTKSGLFQLDGQNWTQTAENFKNTTFAISATTNHLYAGQQKGGVLKSTHHGNDWEQMNNGLDMSGGDNFQVRDIFIEHVEGGSEVMYIATTTGIWQWSGTP